LAFLRDLDARLAVAGQLGGAERGFADAAIMPFVRQFAAIDRAWFAGQPLPHLQRWLDRHLASDLFNAVMMRVEPWSPGDAPVLTPVQLP
jgi:glutathione S-transferase